MPVQPHSWSSTSNPAARAALRASSWVFICGWFLRLGLVRPGVPAQRTSLAPWGLQPGVGPAELFVRPKSPYIFAPHSMGRLRDHGLVRPDRRLTWTYAWLQRELC